MLFKEHERWLFFQTKKFKVDNNSKKEVKNETTKEQVEKLAFWQALNNPANCSIVVKVLQHIQVSKKPHGANKSI